MGNFSREMEEYTYVIYICVCVYVFMYTYINAMEKEMQS